jgi:hypothetical protein
MKGVPKGTPFIAFAEPLPFAIGAKVHRFVMAGRIAGGNHRS